MYNKSYSLPGDINNVTSDRHSVSEKMRVNKVTITILLLYLLTSVITLFLHLPISTITLIIPVLAVPFTVWAIKYDVRPARRISLNSTCTCLCLKLVSIVAYYVIFERNKHVSKIKEANYARRVALLDEKNKEYDMKVIFMAGIILGETLIFILYAFIQWHRTAFKKNKKRNRIDREVVRF
uniref:Endoplasmic reticulum transmembrane protein n=1 Tax=Strongyloides papillosus TaxID=174720 RepID=A0A0N5BD72_STREA